MEKEDNDILEEQDFLENEDIEEQDDLYEDEEELRTLLSQKLIDIYCARLEDDLNKSTKEQFGFDGFQIKKNVDISFEQVITKNSLDAILDDDAIKQLYEYCIELEKTNDILYGFFCSYSYIYYSYTNDQEVLDYLENTDIFTIKEQFRNNSVIAAMLLKGYFNYVTIDDELEEIIDQIEEANGEDFLSKWIDELEKYEINITTNIFRELIAQMYEYGVALGNYEAMPIIDEIVTTGQSRTNFIREFFPFEKLSSDDQIQLIKIILIDVHEFLIIDNYPFVRDMPTKHRIIEILNTLKEEEFFKSLSIEQKSTLENMILKAGSIYDLSIFGVSDVSKYVEYTIDNSDYTSFYDLSVGFRYQIYYFFIDAMFQRKNIIDNRKNLPKEDLLRLQKANPFYKLDK